MTFRKERLTRKQSQLLMWLQIKYDAALEENDPRDATATTFDIFELITQMQMQDQGNDAPGFVGWDRGALSVTLTRMEKRGLVERLPAEDHHITGNGMPHWNPLSGIGPYLPRNRRARYAWRITAEGRRVFALQPEENFA